MVHFDASREIDASGQCIVHVLSSPGSTARDHTPAGAVLARPAAIDDYLACLRRRGKSTPDSGSVAVEVVETFTFATDRHGESTILLSSDSEPLTQLYLETQTGAHRADSA